jgi:hypothetical protein
MARVKARADSQITLDLKWDGETVTYKSKRLTIDVEEDLAEVGRRIEEIELRGDAPPLEQITVQVEQLDVMLERNVPDDTKPALPSEVILEQYKSGELTGPEVRKLVGDVIRASRPT